MKPSGVKSSIQHVLNASHPDPFSFLGMHVDSSDASLTVRAFLPNAVKAAVIDAETGESVSAMRRTHKNGFFSAKLKDRTAPFAYQLRFIMESETHTIDDPYRFPPYLGELDTHLLAEGRHYDSYKKLGAHPVTIDGVDGVNFAVWAPNASRVAVVGDFNEWDGRRHGMRLHPGCGVWEIFLPGVERGGVYKFEIKDRYGNLCPLKSDPYCFRAEHLPPHTASVVQGLGTYAWQDQDWMNNRSGDWRREAVSIYEVHLGSWQRGDNGTILSYAEIADRLIPYVQEMQFTHIELLPISEFPFDGSWGYQPISLFAPTSRFGDPDEFRTFVDRCHRAGIGIILDWVPAHFPNDAHGLTQFDGTHLYEHEDPRLGKHMDWGTLIYNYGRNEVANFLLSNANYWLDEYHIDGLRVDAVASMIYLDYSRAEGDWIPNKQGGRENLEAIEFLKRMNELAYSRNVGIFTVAEESTAWPGVSTPTDAGGLGFGFKWNMGWMHDTLRYFGMDPIHRRHHHNDLTFGLLYAFTENFILPLSHDEVVHGKGSILRRMPGDRWQQFANLRAYYAFMYTYPGKKLLFMGSEFGQDAEWNYQTSLDWHLMDSENHRGVRTLVRDLNALYRDCPALHERDCEGDGFAWSDCENANDSVLAYIRYGEDRAEPVVVVCNLTPVPRHGYPVGVPELGWYAELINSDAEMYGGTNTGNDGGASAIVEPVNGLPFRLRLTLPPLGVIVLHREKGA